MTLRDNLINNEEEPFREAFDKVLACVHSSDTIEQLETTKKMLDRFMCLYDPDSIYVVFLEFVIEAKERELKRKNNGK